MNEMLKTIHIVGLGLGPGDLGPAALRIVEAADVLAGGRRQLQAFPDHAGGKIVLAGPLEPWLDQVAATARDRRVVVLTSGDPNFFGVAHRVISRVGAENVRIHPNVTTIQAAFSRLKEPWDDAFTVSLHGRDVRDLFIAVQEYDKVAVLTDPQNSPDRIARLLLDRDQAGWRMAVIEDLGSPDSRVSFNRLPEAADKKFSDLNLVVLWRKDRPEALTIGTPERAFQHEAGLITKSEIRAVILSRLALTPGLTLWDLGAGCGSVGLEACLLLRGGRVIAVERRPERIEQIRANRGRFGMAILDIRQGEMPAALDDLPDPDRVFIGGGGPDLGEIVAKSVGRLKPGGGIVSAAVKLETLETARRAMAEAGLSPEVVQVQISRGEPLGGGEFLRALNPVWIISGWKPENGANDE